MQVEKGKGRLWVYVSFRDLTRLRRPPSWMARIWDGGQASRTAMGDVCVVRQQADNCNNRQSSAQQRKHAREELGASEEEWHTHTAREVQTYAGCFASKQNEDDDDDGSLSCSGRFA